MCAERRPIVCKRERLKFGLIDVLGADRCGTLRGTTCFFAAILADNSGNPIKSSARDYEFELNAHGNFSNTYQSIANLPAEYEITDGISSLVPGRYSAKFESGSLRRTYSDVYRKRTAVTQCNNGRSKSCRRRCADPGGYHKLMPFQNE